MRPIVAILGFVVVVAGLAASSATAASSQTKIRIDGQVGLDSNGLRLVVTYDCPVGTSTFITASITQPDTGAVATSFVPIPVTCTGTWVEIALGMTVLPGPAFVPGSGVASAHISGGSAALVDDRTRSVRIVD